MSPSSLCIRAACLTLLFATAIASPTISNRRYPGELSLNVDLTNPKQRIFRVQERIPVSPGSLTLYYPKWIPGEHAPSGPVDGVTGLIIVSDDGTRIEWRRDLEDMYTLHVTVPPATHYLQLNFEFLSAASGGAFGQSVSTTDCIEDLEWNQVVFYPAGYSARSVSIRPSVKVPDGWQTATALTTTAHEGGTTNYDAVSLEQLVDSPLLTGLHFTRLDLAPGAAAPVHLDLVADDDADLIVTDAQLTAHRKLVTQAVTLFGAQHYGHYDFLFTLSENTGHFGLEHSQSSDDRLWAKYFIDADSYLAGGFLLSHEYVHSWNGKFRRPADLATANYNLPMRDDLLWVYEGLTNYLGEVLAARAGIWTPEQYRDYLAMTAANMDHRPGRQWRDLQDTADAAQVMEYQPGDFSSWRRTADYYPEGSLIWLDVDTTIREHSAGKRSLDDFLHAFYGMEDGSFVVKPYTFEDIVKALNAVLPYDWSTFLRSRLESHEERAPLGGVTRGGWKLAYTDQPSPIFKGSAKINKIANLNYSLGLVVDTAPENLDTIVNVLWKGPAFAAGLSPGMKLIAIDDRQFDAEKIDEILRAAEKSDKPLEILVKDYDRFFRVKIDYHQGPLYPHLVRVEGTPDRLDDILAPR